MPKEDEDLNTRAEIRLGELIKEKYNTDYYILDKFPTSVRPFYAMEDRENSKVTNSFDIFIRGQEICTGGQRIHDIDELEKKMQRLSIPAKGMQEYLEGFRLGAPPHAGCGIGLERLVMLYLNLGDVVLAPSSTVTPRVCRCRRMSRMSCVILRQAPTSSLEAPSSGAQGGWRERLA